ncbi:hypothetical protein FVEN_g4827 [Fusarium venenatum]|uniref:Uncharacterized protein n=1 Tax=Fusarium venenatum TaxID=56646 RepID=A0A2L2SYN2_9HYPO|nr:uncharacterized protein FVRRES_11304 [Fusarium venenatum]KAG8357440.1 hypothetical protein FVEN_g4827 [Fusarium venenatum]KAH6978016.1 hypothetical protein EDB82DRAFT_557506 [Fusarium venenatum]CEI38613.1 unnamed protein product [Fusarium venenatum]
MAPYNFVSPADSLTPFVGDYQAAHTGYAVSQYNPVYFAGMDPMHASGGFAGYPVAHPYAHANVESPEPVEISVEGGIVAMMSQMSTGRRAIAERITQENPDIDSKDFHDCILIPSKTDREERREYILLLREYDVSYDNIVILGDLEITASTVRGIHRNATRPAAERPRDTSDQWTLEHIAAMRLSVSIIQHREGLDPLTVDGMNAVPWAKVAKMMENSLPAGSFKFSPMAVSRYYKALMNEEQ